MHVLEAGWDSSHRPVVLLLHGFPELAYSWRSIMPQLADAGFRVLAPDQRGYGRTSGWDSDYDGDLGQFRPLNLVRDALSLLDILDISEAYLSGHDFGSPVAAWCAMLRPDLFPRVALMSAPFGGPPPIALSSEVFNRRNDELAQALAALGRPRKHYQHFYQTREADEDLWHAPQGVHNFLRAYYHHKSADWAGNRPVPLADQSAESLAVMPTYYVMDLADGMAATVAQEMPDESVIRHNQWLPDAALAVYSTEYQRTGFQGGLNWYRAVGLSLAEQSLFHGRSLQQPSLFIAGKSDWGTYQSAGALERMQHSACADLRDIHLLEGAGHWVQQEQAEEAARLLIEFFSG